MTTVQYKEVLKELREIRVMQAAQATDIDFLKQWKVAEDAARSAVKEYRDSETKAQMDRIKAREGNAWIDILKQGSIVLAILAAILYAYLQTRRLK